MKSRIIRPNYPEGVETRYLDLPSGHGIFVARQPQVPPFGQAWGRYGACRKNNDVNFLPPPWTPKPEIRKAAAICMTCPVNNHCLEEAMAHPPKLDGLWGGTDKKDRALIRHFRPQEASRSLSTRELGEALIDFMALVGGTDLDLLTPSLPVAGR